MPVLRAQFMRAGLPATQNAAATTAARNGAAQTERRRQGRISSQFVYVVEPIGGRSAQCAQPSPNCLHGEVMPVTFPLWT